MRAGIIIAIILIAGTAFLLEAGTASAAYIGDNTFRSEIQNTSSITEGGVILFNGSAGWHGDIIWIPTKGEQLYVYYNTTGVVGSLVFGTATQIIPFENASSWRNSYKWKEMWASVGAISVYHFDINETFDSSSYGSDFTEAGSVDPIAGAIGNGVDFETGDGDALAVANPPGWATIGAGNYSLWFWADHETEEGFIYSKTSSHASNSFYTHWSNPGYNMGMSTDVTNNEAKAVGSFGGMTAIFEVYNRTHHAAYANANWSSVDSNTLTGNPTTNTAELELGRRWDSQSYYDGIIDEFIAFNISTSREMIEAYYNSTIGGYYETGTEEEYSEPTIQGTLEISTPINGSYDNNLTQILSIENLINATDMCWYSLNGGTNTTWTTTTGWWDWDDTEDLFENVSSGMAGNYSDLENCHDENWETYMTTNNPSSGSEDTGMIQITESYNVLRVPTIIGFEGEWMRSGSSGGGVNVSFWNYSSSSWYLHPSLSIGWSDSLWSWTEQVNITQMSDFFMAGEPFMVQTNISDTSSSVKMYYTDSKMRLYTTLFPDLYITGTEGQNTVTVWCNDTSGRMLSDTNNFTLDTGAPELTFTSPNGSYYSLNVSINVTANETINTWRYSIDGESWVTFTPNTTIGTAAGEHNITVWANDSAGNIATSFLEFKTASFELDTITYPTTSEEMSTETFKITFSVDDPAGIIARMDNVTLNMNGTWYEMPETSSWKFEKEVTMPIANKDGELLQSYINYTVIYSDSTNMTTGTQMLNTTLSAAWLNITFSGNVTFFLQYGESGEEITAENVTRRRAELGNGTIIVSINDSYQIIKFPNNMNGPVIGDITEYFHIQEIEEQDKVQEVRVWDGTSVVADASIWVFETIGEIEYLIHATMSDDGGRASIPIESGKTYLFRVYATGYNDYVGFHEVIPGLNDVISLEVSQNTSSNVTGTWYTNCPQRVTLTRSCTLTTVLSEQGNISLVYLINEVTEVTSTSNGVSSKSITFTVSPTLANYSFNITINGQLTGAVYITYISDGTVGWGMLPTSVDLAGRYFTFVFLTLLVACMIGASAEQIVTGAGMYAFTATIAVASAYFTFYQILVAVVGLFVLLKVVKRVI